MLNFVEEIVLLLLDDTHGKFIDLPVSATDVVLAGAALMELALQNRVDADPDHVTLVNRTATGDEILDDAIGRLGAAGGSLTATEALSCLTANAEAYQGRAVQSLIEKGILREEDGQFLWVFHTRRYPVVDETEQREVTARLRHLVLTDDIPEPRDVVLLCLIDASNLLHLLLSEDEIEKNRARIDYLVRLDLIGQAVTKAVAEIQVIVRGASTGIY
ncbi:MAG TPA: GPP34 family phosphoprotein [Stellaceae bacterium]|jgi:hypothetical protein|nr:GPP34 family phosphoprotein [Stellaceae bacterium]